MIDEQYGVFGYSLDQSIGLYNYMYMYVICITCIALYVDTHTVYTYCMVEMCSSQKVGLRVRWDIEYCKITSQLISVWLWGQHLERVVNLLQLQSAFKHFLYCVWNMFWGWSCHNKHGYFRCINSITLS